MDITRWMLEEQVEILLHIEDWLRSEEMAKVRYLNEKEQIIAQLWQIVFRSLGDIDDAGCDWFTVGNITCIADTSWQVSQDAEVARLINAINALQGNPDLIYARFSDVPSPRSHVETEKDMYYDNEL